ncbi:hypothetical protein RUM43_002408 [Polyplax serrata]|uniref:Uncharacterized protein n=1 Tax=Polyplax serrata TaxID=468196 RepID=A0AAN8PZH9_POLSC
MTVAPVVIQPWKTQPGAVQSVFEHTYELCLSKKHLENMDQVRACDTCRVSNDKFQNQYEGNVEPSHSSA